MKFTFDKKGRDTKVVKERALLTAHGAYMMWLIVPIITIHLIMEWELNSYFLYGLGFLYIIGFGLISYRLTDLTKMFYSVRVRTIRKYKYLIFIFSFWGPIIFMGSYFLIYMLVNN
jgi:hypothetical protein